MNFQELQMKATHSAVTLSIIALCAFIPRAYAASQTLNQALATAYQNNPALAAARAKLRATDEQVAQAMGGWRPTISATADDGTSHQSMSGNGYASVSKGLNPRDVSLNITQPLFSGFKTTSGIKAAEYSVQAERAALKDTEQQVFLATAKAYLGVVQAHDILTLDSSAETILQNKLAEVKDRLRIHDLSKTDVDQAQSRLDAATVARLQAENDLATQRQAYMRLVGDMPGTLQLPAPDYAIPKNQLDAVSLALHNNPAVVAARYGEDAASENITTAEGNLLPSVDLVGNAAHNVDQGPASPTLQNSATVEVRLTIPFYSAGTNYSKTRAAEDIEQQRRMDFADACAKASTDAATAWQSYMTAVTAEKEDESLVASETSAYHGVVLQAKYGTRTTLDVLNAEQEMLNANIDLAKAKHDEIFAMLQLKSAVGSLTATALNLPVKKYDPTKYYDKVRDQWIGFSNTQEQ